MASGQIINLEGVGRRAAAGVGTSSELCADDRRSGGRDVDGPQIAGARVPNMELGTLQGAVCKTQEVAR
ncbi:hypothetical protein EYF80_028602 [Liparis tanakae]|uniref:Uncharacterized protein n=1 Tax=Liparis tanakae TaxID=230148 RepID=A0A4Z2H5R2_9TELE|nr:hypothetical protein EYF80_028602 [Liparis tanakae]